MSRIGLVGNEFILPQTSLKVAMPVSAAPELNITVPVVPVRQVRSRAFSPHVEVSSAQPTPWSLFVDLLHRYSLGAFALLFLLVGSSAIEVAAAYRSAHISTTPAVRSSLAQLRPTPAKGPNTVVSTPELAQALQRVTTQSLSINVSGKAVPLSAATIQSWLKVVADSQHKVTYIHVNEPAINKSLNDLAAPYVKAPVNQVVMTQADGSSQVIAAGRNGAQLGDITAATKQITQGLLAGRGLQATLPIETLPFSVITPAAFNKLIEVNVVTKQMYLYDKGELTRSYPISAGAPATPTPIGQFQIYSKFAVQDMRGFNANGTKYFQPHVRWISYFLPGGYAVHGNYWRPQSWFGAVNSSHGCVSLPDVEAKWVYDWAPLGTTVITHY